MSSGTVSGVNIGGTTGTNVRPSSGSSVGTTTPVAGQNIGTSNTSSMYKGQDIPREGVVIDRSNGHAITNTDDPRSPAGPNVTTNPGDMNANHSTPVNPGQSNVGSYDGHRDNYGNNAGTSTPSNVPANRGGNYSTAPSNNNVYQTPPTNTSPVTPSRGNRGWNGGGYDDVYSSPSDNYNRANTYQAPQSSPQQNNRGWNNSAPNNGGNGNYQSSPAPQQNYSAPQRSYSAPQQNYSAPERSYSPPQQNYSAPQRSYSPPQQNYSAPQRSYSPPSGGGGGGGGGFRGSSPAPSGGGGGMHRR